MYDGENADAVERAVRRWTRRLCLSAADGEDCAVLFAFKMKTTVAPCADPRWLNRCAFHFVVSYKRALDRQARLLVPNGGELLDFLCNRESAADELWRSEFWRIVRNALRQLPPRQRVVFTLRCIEGASSEEAALALGLTPNAVDQLLSRARKNLQNRLAESDCDEQALWEIAREFTQEAPRKIIPPPP